MSPSALTSHQSASLMFYEKVLAPLLFSIEAESAHNLALGLLRWASRSEKILGFLTARPEGADSRFQQTLGGIRFPNPIGLAAGFDKNGVAAPALAALGFGFVTIGTVTPRTGQPGQPRPRLFRDIRNRALWNRLGFNNRGADTMARLLDKQGKLPIPLGISIGKAANTPIEGATADYLYSLERLYPYADFFEICISSPNTSQLRDLQSEEPLDALLKHLVAKANELAARAGSRNRKPLWPKFAPDMTPAERDRAVTICMGHLDPELDAVVMGNSTIDPAINPAIDKGGYSGRPLFAKALSEVRSVQRVLGANRNNGRPLTLIGCGGIFDGEDAFEMLQQGGCQLVQLHTAFPYRGPGVARKIRRELARAMDRAGIGHIAEIAASEDATRLGVPAVEEMPAGLDPSQRPG